MPMTVKRLRDLLAEFPDEMPVLAESRHSDRYVLGFNRVEVDGTPEFISDPAPKVAAIVLRTGDSEASMADEREPPEGLVKW